MMICANTFDMLDKRNAILFPYVVHIEIILEIESKG